MDINQNLNNFIIFIIYIKNNDLNQIPNLNYEFMLGTRNSNYQPNSAWQPQVLNLGRCNEASQLAAKLIWPSAHYHNLNRNQPHQDLTFSREKQRNRHQKFFGAPPEKEQIDQTAPTHHQNL